MDIRAFVEKWERSGAAEHANSQSFLNDLCDMLPVERPRPATGDAKLDQYIFEKPVLLAKEGNASIGHIDLYKRGAFVLEAKQGSNIGTQRIGTARRGTPAWNIAMRDAYGQALGYAQTLDEPPPFIITTDIGYCFEFYAAFDGSGAYRAFPNAQTNRVYLRALLDAEAGPKHLDTLRAVFTDPLSLDPSQHATKVTREVAAHLAELARILEEAKHPPERVAKFLMRCIFTMFAEDVGLLPDGLFQRLIEEHWLPNPPSFPGGIRSLWKAMNDGSDYFVGKLLKFNGGLFKDSDALPLTAEHLLRLQEAAACDWAEVEPAIFGTLLERALDPHERHKLGAHFTPRAYVERLVRPTIEEPLRAEWDLVRAEVRQLVEAGKEQQAKKSVRAFYDKLTHTRVLDPACGTGNFLYVTLDIFKRLEADVVALLGELEEKQVLGEGAGYGVTPQQFLGIEVKPWAKEIAELVLWIGYLQWHFRTRGRVNPPEPVLHDYGNIELRDAVLAFDREELVRDESGRPVSRWDGHTFKKSPVTGVDVPDEDARAPVYRYINARKATWPKADFIVGNPPFIGNKRMRAALGDGYVEALRDIHDDVPEAADFVMYWWNHAAHLVRSGTVKRFGLITTNSIWQSFSRAIPEAHVSSGDASFAFAIPDHPWVDATDGAAVRVAMSVVGPGSFDGTLAKVTAEKDGRDEAVDVELSYAHGRINADFTIGINTAAAIALQSNAGLGFRGITLVGDGFIIPNTSTLARKGPVRTLVGARALLGTGEPRLVIDLYGFTEERARREYPQHFQHLYDSVRPFRLQQKRATYATHWWVFAEPRSMFRCAADGLRRYIATVETSRHRWFTFVPGDALPEQTLVAIADSDPFTLSVLSSRVHTLWAAATGSRLGVGNDLRYTIARCFDTFPFPECDDKARDRLREGGEALDEHRKRQQREFPDLTLTGMYNVLAKLRAGEPLTPKEKVIHEHGVVSVLRELQDEVDAATLNAYGWPQHLPDEEVLARLVDLNAERAAEESRGVVRWLRPAIQNIQGSQRATQVALVTNAPIASQTAAASLAPWPTKLHERIAAVREVIAHGRSLTTFEVSKMFTRARRADVEEVLNTLAALGFVVSFTAGPDRRWRAAGRAAAA